MYVFSRPIDDLCTGCLCFICHPGRRPVPAFLVRAPHGPARQSLAARVLMMKISAVAIVISSVPSPDGDCSQNRALRWPELW